MLRGQWSGPYAGTNSGEIIAEFDEVDSRIVGTITAYPADPKYPPVFVPVVIPAGLTSLDQVFPVYPIDWNTGDPVPWETVAANYPGITMARVVDTKWRLSQDDTLYAGWTSETGHGLAVLTRGTPSAPSTRVPLPITTWEEFKIYTVKFPPHRYLFRGQSSNQWRLRTHFHRTGRADLRRFTRDDVQMLHRNLTGLTTHYFDIRDPIQNGAFHALIQHHGYPTPLLDWTASPYVAAYFAYRPVKKTERVDDQKVRILIFDSQQWTNDFNQVLKFTPARRHFSLFAPIGINNSRLVPQQAISSISNVDDIEGYLEEREQERQKTYLTVIDLPKSERQKVMQELGMMGITAGSLFPGLDGACEQLRERYFDY